jgi:hypothetical protein
MEKRHEIRKNARLQAIVEEQVQRIYGDDEYPRLFVVSLDSFGPTNDHHNPTDRGRRT